MTAPGFADAPGGDDNPLLQYLSELIATAQGAFKRNVNASGE